MGVPSLLATIEEGPAVGPGALGLSRTTFPVAEPGIRGASRVTNGLLGVCRAAGKPDGVAEGTRGTAVDPATGAAVGIRAGVDRAPAKDPVGTGARHGVVGDARLRGDADGAWIAPLGSAGRATGDAAGTAARFCMRGIDILSVVVTGVSLGMLGAIVDAIERVGAGAALVLVSIPWAGDTVARGAGLAFEGLTRIGTDGAALRISAEGAAARGTERSSGVATRAGEATTGPRSAWNEGVGRGAALRTAGLGR